MKLTAKTLLLTFTVATAAATLIHPAANAATGDEDGTRSTFLATPKAPSTGPADFTTKEATPKAERTEPAKDRQIVVEPKQEQTEETPVANLNPPVEEIEQAPVAPQQDQAAAKPKLKAETDGEQVIVEDPFAPQTKAEPAKVEMPTVFTDKQKDLFTKLDTTEQKKLVTRLVEKYGYDAMYPKEVSRTYLDDYRKKQSTADSYQYQNGYGDTYQSGNYTSNGYGSGYYNCQ